MLLKLRWFISLLHLILFHLFISLVSFLLPGALPSAWWRSWWQKNGTKYIVSRGKWLDFTWRSEISRERDCLEKVDRLTGFSITLVLLWEEAVPIGSLPLFVKVLSIEMDKIYHWPFNFTLNYWFTICCSIDENIVELLWSVVLGTRHQEGSRLEHNGSMLMLK